MYINKCVYTPVIISQTSLKSFIVYIPKGILAYLYSLKLYASMLTYFGTALYFGKVCLIVFVYHRMIHLFVAHSNLCIRLCLFAQESVLLWVVVLFIAAQVRQILTFQLNIVFTVFDSFSMVIKDTLRCYNDDLYKIYNILYCSISNMEM